MSEFGGQNGVLQKTGGSENGALLGMRVHKVTQRQPK